MNTLLCCEKGIAMTEGVMVVPVFIVIWMGLITMHHLYAGRLEAQVNAGNLAMQMSRAGECQNNDVSSNEYPQTHDLNDNIGETESGWVSALTGGQPFAWSHATVRTGVEVDGIPVPMGGPSREMYGKQTYMCNMKQVDGFWELVWKMAKEMLDS